MQTTPANSTLSPAVGARQFTPFRSEVNPRDLALAGIEKIQSLCCAETTSSIAHNQKRDWTLAIGEALCMLSESSNLSTIHYSQDSQRPGAEEAYQSFAEEIAPQIAKATELARTSIRAIATCGAMDLFNQYVKASSAAEKGQVISRFLGALSLGNSVSGREVFARLGASFMPSAATLRESVSSLMKHLQ